MNVLQAIQAFFTANPTFPFLLREKVAQKANDDGGEIVPMALLAMQVVDQEGNSSVPPLSMAGKYRFKPDGTFQLWNADQNKFHTITVTGAAQAETISVGAGEA
jgi:hypothetical protein